MPQRNFNVKFVVKYHQVAHDSWQHHGYMSTRETYLIQVLYVSL